MTTKELNRDCKRLITLFKKGHKYVYNEDSSIKEEFIKELKRVYYADSNFEYLSPKNALGLMRINLSLRVIPLHQFGIGYEL
jgi:hypothetical protein